MAQKGAALRFGLLFLGGLITASFIGSYLWVKKRPQYNSTKALTKEMKAEKNRTAHKPRESETWENQITRQLDFYEDVNKDNTHFSKLKKTKRSLDGSTKAKKAEQLDQTALLAEVPDRSRPLVAPPMTTETVSKEPSHSAYTVQVGAFKGEDPAKTFAIQLISKGYGAYVEPPLLAPDIFYRVKIGSFETKVQAQKLAEELKREGFQTIIKKE